MTSMSKGDLSCSVSTGIRCQQQPCTLQGKEIQHKSSRLPSSVYFLRCYLSMLKTNSSLHIIKDWMQCKCKKQNLSLKQGKAQIIPVTWFKHLQPSWMFNTHSYHSYLRHWWNKWWSVSLISFTDVFRALLIWHGEQEKEDQAFH